SRRSRTTCGRTTRSRDRSSGPRPPTSSCTRSGSWRNASLRRKTSNELVTQDTRGAQDAGGGRNGRPDRGPGLEPPPVLHRQDRAEVQDATAQHGYRDAVLLRRQRGHRNRRPRPGPQVEVLRPAVRRPAGWTHDQDAVAARATAPESPANTWPTPRGPPGAWFFPGSVNRQ